ncbi:N-acetylmuramoyl-L-alanine amidase [Chitinophaga sp. CF418]|nr:N-acetylmuramoyl-L-alanine amidase [Chitinophaga sp. CF418]
MTWHVGEVKDKSYPTNSNSIGIEVVGAFNDETEEWEPVTPEQIISTAWLTNNLLNRYGLGFDDIYSHDQISKKEPGEGTIVRQAISPYLVYPLDENDSDWWHKFIHSIQNMIKSPVKNLLLLLSLVSLQCTNSHDHSSEIESDSISRSSVGSSSGNVDTSMHVSAAHIRDTSVVINDTTSILIKSMEKVTGINGKGEPIISKCKDWTLDSASIVKMIRNSYPINSHDFMYLYNVLECELTGKIAINNVPYKIVINAGSYFKLFGNDTTYIFGCSSENCKQFFLKQGGDPERDLGAY